jgi:predicted deacetylase
MKKIKIIILAIVSLVAIIFLIRLLNPTEIDDISPGIPCPEIEQYNPDNLYVIPNFAGIPLSENTEFCKEILSLNKTLALHGINHTYREFLYENISQENLNFAISEFEKCFNQTPKIFKPSHLQISKTNKKIIKENNLELKTWFNQGTHKVYHCNNSGRMKNFWVRIF